MRSSSRTRSSSFLTPELPNRFIRIHGSRAYFAEKPAPSIDQIGRNPMTPGRRRNRFSRLKTLLDNPQLLLDCPRSPEDIAGNHFNASCSLDMSLSSSLCFSLPAYAECPVEMGGSSLDHTAKDLQ